MTRQKFCYHWSSVVPYTDASNVEYLLVFVFIIVLIFLIVKFADSDRYARMTDKEFEAESRRASKMAGPIAVFQKLIDPGHHVEFVQKQKEGKPQGSQSGDPPEPSLNPRS